MTKADRLRQLEIFLCIGLAIALNISLTVSWAFLIAGIVVTFLRPNRAERAKSLLKAPLTIPLAVFGLALAVSVLANGGLADSQQIFTNLRSFAPYFYIYQAFAQDDGIEQKSLSALLSVAALAGLYAMVQQIFNFHPFTFPWLQGTGFMSEPMAFVGVMQITSFLGLGIFLKKGYAELPGVLKNQKLFLAIVLANFTGLFFACERSAWLGMFAGVLFILMRYSFKIFAAGLTCGALVLTLAWFCVPAVQTRIMPLINNPQSDKSVSARLVFWSVARDQYVHHPLVGVGPSHYPRIVVADALVPGRSKDFVHAHSNYFHVLATLGTLGFLAFMALLIFSCLTALKQGKQVAFPGGVGLGTFGALVSLMVSGLFEYNFGAAQVRLTLWFLLGALRLDRVDENKVSEG